MFLFMENLMKKRKLGRLRNVFLNLDCFLTHGENDYLSDIKIILSNPYYACLWLYVLEKVYFLLYSCRLKACIFTESKLIYNTRSSAARRCSGKYAILNISQNSRVNNCTYSLELY